MLTVASELRLPERDRCRPLRRAYAPISRAAIRSVGGAEIHCDRWAATSAVGGAVQPPYQFQTVRRKRAGPQQGSRPCEEITSPGACCQLPPGSWLQGLHGRVPGSYHLQSPGVARRHTRWIREGYWGEVAFRASLIVAMYRCAQRPARLAGNRLPQRRSPRAFPSVEQ